MEKTKKVTLRETRTDKDVSILEAKIDDDGDLMLEGQDIGKAPQEFWGDSDYEYARVIKKGYKDRISRLLIMERFNTNSDFRKWLDEKGVPGKFWRAIDKDYKDTVLLWLIKERFDSDTGFKTWLDNKSIPSEFWSWV